MVVVRDWQLCNMTTLYLVIKCCFVTLDMMIWVLKCWFLCPIVNIRHFWCEVLVFIDFCQYQLIILFMLVLFIQVKQLTVETLNK